MATILRAADAHDNPRAAAFNFDDFAALAERHIADARAEAARIVSDANDRADAICRQAEQAGREAATRDAERLIAEQTAPAAAALTQAAGAIARAKQAWLSHWENQAVHLAAAMAAKVIRQELSNQPEINLALAREALELAAGSPKVRLHLNPEDHRALGGQVRVMVDAMSSIGDVEVIADPTLTVGGCRVETQFGTIDQQVESQLGRIVEELVG